MSKYTHELVISVIHELGGELRFSTLGKHGNKQLARMDIRFNSWWLTSWFDFKAQTARSPVYWMNKNPRGSFQFVMGCSGMSISEFLNELELIITTNSLPIDQYRLYRKLG